MMLFKCSFGLTRSLFILYVHEHDHLGFEMLTVETAVIHLFNSSNSDRKGQSYPVEIIWNQWKSTLRVRSI